MLSRAAWPRCLGFRRNAVTFWSWDICTGSARAHIHAHAYQGDVQFHHAAARLAPPLPSAPPLPPPAPACAIRRRRPAQSCTLVSLAQRKRVSGRADTCAICRNKLYEPSIEAQANPGLADDAGYSIAWGCCGHVFHLDCISRWLKTRSVCPLCNREWEFAKIEKIATVSAPLSPCSSRDVASTATHSCSAPLARERSSAVACEAGRSGNSRPFGDARAVWSALFALPSLAFGRHIMHLMHPRC